MSLAAPTIVLLGAKSADSARLEAALHALGSGARLVRATLETLGTGSDVIVAGGASTEATIGLLDGVGALVPASTMVVAFADDLGAATRGRLLGAGAQAVFTWGNTAPQLVDEVASMIDFWARSRVPGSVRA